MKNLIIIALFVWGIISAGLLFYTDNKYNYAVDKHNALVEDYNAQIYLYSNVVKTKDLWMGRYSNLTLRNQELLKENRKLHNNAYYDKRCIMWNQEGIAVKRPSNVNGIYYPDHRFYVVWVEDRVLSNIERTDQHEACHDYVTYDVDGHFCGD